MFIELGVIVNERPGIWDTEGKNYRNLGYYKKTYWDIQHQLFSQDFFLTFQLIEIMLNRK